MSLLPADGWTALLVQGLPKSTAVLAAPAARVLGVPLADASTRCRLGQGLYPASLREGQARALAKAWTAAGFEAKERSWQECVEPPPARPIGRGVDVWLGEEALDVAEVGTLPWAELGAIHLDLVAPAQAAPAQGEGEDPATGEPGRAEDPPLEALPARVVGLVDDLGEDSSDIGYFMGLAIAAAERRRGRQPERTAERKEFAKVRTRAPGPPREWLELYGARSALRIRIDPDEFPYRCLPGEPALSTRANLRRLIRLLRERAPHALEVGLEEVAPSTRKVMELAEHEWRVASMLARERHWSAAG